MSTILLDVLEYQEMASGNRSLILTRSVSWREFGNYAPQLIEILNGKLIVAADSVVERVWEIHVNGNKYWFCFDDYSGVSLDSIDEAADQYLETIREFLIGQST